MGRNGISTATSTLAQKVRDSLFSPEGHYPLSKTRETDRQTDTQSTLEKMYQERCWGEGTQKQPRTSTLESSVNSNVDSVLH